MSTARKYDGAELPDGWRMVRLGDVAEAIMGQSPPGNTVVELNGAPEAMAGLPFIQGNAEFGRMFPTPSKWCVKPLKVAEVDDVLFSVRAPVGDVNRAAQSLGIGRGVAAIRFTGAYPVFGWHSINHSRNRFERLAQGSTFEAIGGPEIRALPILLPPLSEQRAIANVLDSIDEAIERTEAVITATETLRNSLLHELLTRGVPGWHTEWKGVPGVGTIPADWEVVRLGEVIETSTYGTNEPLGDNGNIVVLRMNNIRRGEIDWSDVKRAELSEKELNELDLQPGDILFNRTNSLDLVGKIAMIRDLPEPTSFASYLVRIRTKAERARPIWSSALLGSNGYQSRIRRFATPGVSQANINPTSLKSLTIPLPSISEQANVIAVLDVIREQMQHARHERDSLGQAKSAIADALLSGRMRSCKIAH